MEFQVLQFRWHELFHGIPWNFKCANFTDISSFMEFQGTWIAPISMTRAVPWYSTELQVRQFYWHKQFHGMPRNLDCANFDDTSSSMEFHGTWSAPISLARAVPWNSMEFRRTLGAPISLTRAVPWNSIEFHGTCSVPISLTWAVVWNSMELQVRQFRWHEKFQEIPWN